MAKVGVFRKVYMGSGYLEGYGHHPGSGWAFVFICLTTCAGLHHGFMLGLVGFVSGTVFYGGIFLCGAYSRATSYLKDIGHE